MKDDGRRAPFLAAAMALVAALGIWRGYARSHASSAVGPPKADAGLIIIGAETWPGYMPLFVARDKGYFRDEGLQVEVKRYVALGQLSKDYVAGKMQARANLTLDAVNEHLQGLEHRAVLAIDHSNGSDAIAARNGIRQVKDFVGKRVGYEPDTLEEFFISWALRQRGLSLRDIISVPGDPEKTGSMLESGQVDVAVTHEPFLSKVIGTGRAHTVYSSADAPGLITDILTFRSDYIAAHPEAVMGVLRAYFKALDFWKEHPQEACAILAAEFGDTPESIRRQMQGITMLDIKDNYTAFSFAAGLQSLYGNMRQVGDFVQTHKRNTDMGAFETERLVEPHFIRALVREKGR